MRKLKILVPLAGAAVIVGAATLGSERDTQAQSRGPMISGETVTVEVRGVGGSVPVGGTVVPFKEVVIAAQLPGRVVYIAGEEGDRFKKGKVLVGLDEDELRAQRRAAQAQIGNAEATLRNAGVQYSRERTAPRSQNMMDQFMPGLGDMFGGDENHVERRANLYAQGVQIEQARSGLLQAQSRLQQIDAKLRDARGVAPFDGIILKKNVNKGDTVQPGQPLVVFADDRSLQLQVDVPSRLMSGLRQGRVMPLRLDDVHKTEVQGRVARVFPMADTIRHTVRVKLDIPSAAPAAAGMYAEALIPDPLATMANSYPVIPASAVVSRGGLPYAYRLTTSGRPSLTLLRLGDRVDDGHVIVLTGLTGGETILRDPQ